MPLLESGPVAEPAVGSVDGTVIPDGVDDAVVEPAEVRGVLDGRAATSVAAVAVPTTCEHAETDSADTRTRARAARGPRRDVVMSARYKGTPSGRGERSGRAPRLEQFAGSAWHDRRVRTLLRHRGGVALVGLGGWPTVRKHEPTDYRARATLGVPNNRVAGGSTNLGGPAF